MRLDALRAGEGEADGEVDNGHGGDGGESAEGAAALISAKMAQGGGLRVVAGERGAEKGEVHEIADDARPHGHGRFRTGEKSGAGGEFAGTEEADEVFVLLVDADAAGEGARREEFDQAEADAEPAEITGKGNGFH